MRLLLLLLVLLVAAPALAVNDWGYSGCDQSTNNTTVGSNKICFDFTTATFTTFNVVSEAALACLKTDVDQEGVSATGGTPATAIVRYCPYGPGTASATNEELCGIQVCTVAGCTLTGLNGIPSAQLACVVVGPGSYRVDFPTLPDSPDIGLFSVEGSD